ncbi:MAG: PilZ domain-containing protein [Terracidiphilus sp.]|jgi:hypothetical protein
MAFTGTSEGEQARTRDERYRDRRAYERFEINAAGGCINYQGSKFPCLIVDVSLSGCCVRTESKFLPGNLANVEVVLPILGMVLRMVGTTQWLTRQNLVGIRFLHASARSKNQLAGLLTGLVDESATEEVKAAVVAAARSGTTALDVEIPEAWLHIPKPVRREAEKQSELPAPAKPREKPVQSGEDEKQTQAEGEWPALLRLLKNNSRQNGAIVGLNLEGCTFRTAELFTSGIHARVEIDFQMRGLPFLLAGVIEDVQDRGTVDIRFLEMSYRKRAELSELIEELNEASKKQAQAPL